MRKLFFVTLVMCGSLNAIANTLRCQLTDERTHRVLDQVQMGYETSQNKSHPILMVLGYRAVTGTVRDFANKDPQDRELELKLSYEVSGASGESYGHAIYRSDSETTGFELAEASIEEPEFRSLIKMTCFSSK